METRARRLLPAIFLGGVALMLSTVLIGNDSQGETKMVTLTTSIGAIELQLDT